MIRQNNTSTAPRRRKLSTQAVASNAGRASRAKSTATRHGAARSYSRDTYTNSRAKQAQSGRSQAAVQSLSRRDFLIRLALSAVVIVTMLFIATNAVNCKVSDDKYAAVEVWRDETSAACARCELGSEWTNAILAAMYVESGGNEDVSSVEGVDHDIMQAAEGAYGYIVKEGSEEYGVSAQTCEASIYAGVLEFKQNLELWHDYLGGIMPSEPSKVQLVVQGYNFGADGWFSWCEQNGIEAYSVDAARRYSDEEMPEGAKGTPTHAEKWLTAYERISGVA